MLKHYHPHTVEALKFHMDLTVNLFKRKDINRNKQGTSKNQNKPPLHMCNFKICGLLRVPPACTFTASTSWCSSSFLSSNKLRWHTCPQAKKWKPFKTIQEKNDIKSGIRIDFSPGDKQQIERQGWKPKSVGSLRKGTGVSSVLRLALHCTSKPYKVVVMDTHIYTHTQPVANTTKCTVMARTDLTLGFSGWLELALP